MADVLGSATTQQAPKDSWVFNASSMVARPGPILKWLGKAFFGAVAFNESYVRAIQEAAARATPIYVLNVRSLIDLLYFNHAFIMRALPLVFFAFGMNLLLFRPIGEVARYLWGRLTGRIRRRPSDAEMLRFALAEGRPCLIWLKRPHSLIQWGDESRVSHIRDLIAAYRQAGRPAVLIPLFVVWDKKPESYRRSFLDVVFGDPQAPGAIRKTIAFFLNFRSARAQVGRPIDLGEFLESNKDAPDDESLAMRLKFALAQEFLLESKAIKGPVLKGARQIVEEIMRTPPFLETVRAVAQAQGMPEETAMQKTRAMLLKMAADFRFRWIEGFALAVTLVFYRLFKGIVVNAEGLDAIREAARSAPIVLVPGHRSHIDYLLLSLVFYTHGLIPPHIASGDNLAFWPMGPIFRHSGAFFIRRSIKGDPLYEAVLSQYLRKLLKEGYWVEFFIEGTRSRSGKTLAPRFGLLKMVIDAIASGAAPDVYFVPAAVTYEKVIEEKAYRAESAGTEKKKESMGALARSARVLRSRYGKVYLLLDQPFSLVEFLRAHGVTVPLPEGASVPREVVRKLAYTIVHRIDRCFLVTPQNLVAFAVLTHPKRGIEFEKLLERIGFLVLYLKARGAKMTDLIAEPLEKFGVEVQGSRKGIAGKGEESVEAVQTIVHALRRPIEDVVSMWHKEKILRLRAIAEREGGSEGAIVSADDEHRIALDYYKNGILNYFVPEAILAYAALCIGEESTEIEALRNYSKRISRVFKFEFIFGAEESFDAIFSATFRSFCEDEIFVVRSGHYSWGKDAREVLTFFAGIIMPFVEGYRILARVVVEGPEGRAEKDLVKAAVRVGRKAFLLGDIQHSEAVNAIIFKNALSFLQSEVLEAGAENVRSAAHEVMKTLIY